MKKLTALLFACCFISLSASAQIVFRGSVKTDSLSGNQPAGFASVILHKLPDTTNVAAATIADIHGNFKFATQPIGKYAVTVSLMGYGDVNDVVSLRMSSTGNEITRSYTLSEQAFETDAIAITASTSKQYIDKKSYTITREDIKNAVHGLDLIEKIPQLAIDPISQTIRSMQGGVKVLINGANASEQELKALDANQVRKIEYYDFPPARYQGAGAVVNVVTKTIEDGLYAGIDLQHAFSTGFGNDGLFVKYNRGRSQFSLNYSLNYRDYKNTRTLSEYDYSIGSDHFKRKQEGFQKFSYNDNFIKLTYSNQLQDKYTLQINFQPSFRNSNDTNSTTIEAIQNSVLSKKYGITSNKGSSFSPVLDVYLWKQLRKRQEIIINVVGTAFDTKQNSFDKEFLDAGGVPTLDYSQNIHNQKYSVIGEGIYIKTLGIGSLSFGDKVMYENLYSDISNTLSGNSKSTTEIISNYTYGEFSGTKGKWLYRATLGAVYSHSSNAARSYGTWVFQPILMAGYNFNDRLSLRAAFLQSNLDPTLSQLSNSTSYVTDHIISRGNPNLRNGYGNQTALILMYGNKWIQLQANAVYAYSKNPVNSYFMEEGGFIVRTYENLTSSRHYGAQYGAYFRFFNNMLTFSFEGGFIWQENNGSHMGNYKHLAIPFKYNVTFAYKGFMAFYQGNIISYELNGPYLESNEKTSNLGVRYNYKNFSASVMCFFFLADPVYKTKSTDVSPVTYNRYNRILDNKSMMTLGISYRFNTGRAYNERARAVNNSDTDAGL